MVTKLEHYLLIAKPGTGRTVWARHKARESNNTLETLALEREYVHRVAGLPAPTQERLPMRVPHHTVSVAGLIGRMRGWRWSPGEASLAHGGTLFLDEIQEFPVASLEALREVFQRRQIALRGENGNTLNVPAVFRLIVAGHPCPCGYLDTPRCTCTAAQVAAYMARIPQWIRDACTVVPAETIAADVKRIRAEGGDPL